uniref:Zinc finger C2HC domain-containing protein 1B-like n=1 Tax=Hirondellea gigas TaxID=1518452 RepID=A0A6A7FUT1_9CRUS
MTTASSPLTTTGRTQAAPAMTTNRGGVSRLGMMQAKLQEQLMVEKESRLLEMAARQQAERDSTIQRVTKSSASSLSSSLSSLSLGSSFSGGQGRVRKMFEDRRSTGYDKSYPLNPVKGKTGSGGATAPGGRTGPAARGVVGGRTTTSNSNIKTTNNTDRGGSYGGGYGQQQRSKSQLPPNSRTTKPNVNSRYNNSNNNNNNSSSNGRLGHHKSNSSLLDADNNAHDNQSTGSRSAVNGSSGRRGPSSPLSTSSTTSTTIPARRHPQPKKTAPTLNKSKAPVSPAPVKPKPATYKVKVPASLAPSPFIRRESTQSKAPAGPKVVPPGMGQCTVCQRCFNSDRIEKHITICLKTQANAKKRKIFDPVKMRNKGTESEKYVARGMHLKEPKKPKKKDWRKQHEDFINTVRAAKGMDGYEAPPLDTSDYEQCPHCGRKFSQMAAERHIPKCEDMKCNKPSMGRKK